MSNFNYFGEYGLEWYARNPVDGSWTNKQMFARLNHDFLEVGHKGSIDITIQFPTRKVININYEFKVSFDSLIYSLIN